MYDDPGSGKPAGASHHGPPHRQGRATARLAGGVYASGAGGLPDDAASLKSGDGACPHCSGFGYATVLGEEFRKAIAERRETGVRFRSYATETRHCPCSKLFVGTYPPLDTENEFVVKGQTLTEDVVRWVASKQ